MEKEIKSEFAQKMHVIAQEATQLVDGQKNKSVIIITTESGDDETETVIVLAGHGLELVKGVAELATNKEAKPVFDFGLRLAQKKMAAQVMETMFEKLLKKTD